MKDFQHANVLFLYGIVIVNDKPQVALPFMMHGDLKKFLSDDQQVVHVAATFTLALKIYLNLGIFLEF